MLRGHQLSESGLAVPRSLGSWRVTGLQQCDEPATGGPRGGLEPLVPGIALEAGWVCECTDFSRQRPEYGCSGGQGRPWRLYRELGGYTGLTASTQGWSPTAGKLLGGRRPAAAAAVQTAPRDRRRPGRTEQGLLGAKPPSAQPLGPGVDLLYFLVARPGPRLLLPAPRPPAAPAPPPGAPPVLPAPRLRPPAATPPSVRLHKAGAAAVTDRQTTPTPRPRLPPNQLRPSVHPANACKRFPSISLLAKAKGARGEGHGGFSQPSLLGPD